MTVLVTGSAGFIGYHLAERLLAEGREVVGFDNLNDYYDPRLKRARLERLGRHAGYRHVKGDLAERAAVEALFAEHKPDRVIHLAAQAGVRHAASDPHVYVASNLTGFLHVLEGCRQHGVAHLVYASTSSVYGANRRLPSSEHHPAEHPVSFYAATKKANEAMAHSYAQRFGLPCTGLRFFTVYGPWGRPDMALFRFTQAILAGEPIEVYHHGRHRRAFTYIDDIVEGVVRLVDRPAEPDPDWDGESPDPARSSAPWRLFNIGSSESIELLRYIEVIESSLGRKAQLILLPRNPDEVLDTWADCSDLERYIGYAPKVRIEEGVPRFVDWYLNHYLSPSPCAA